MANLGNFTFIVFLVIFIYALLGMDLFGNKFHFDDGRPRHNFDTLIWSILSVFQILTGEDWNAVMYDGIRATSSVSAFYFVSLILIGQYTILNLFIAILLANFEAQTRGGRDAGRGADVHVQQQEDLPQDDRLGQAEGDHRGRQDQVQRLWRHTE